MTSICDERSKELLYGGMPITEVFQQDMGIGGVLSLLWCQVELRCKSSKYFNLKLYFL